MLGDAKVLTVSELSEYLRVHRSTIYRLLKKGQLPGFKIGSDWRFNVEAIDQWRFQQGGGQKEELCPRHVGHEDIHEGGGCASKWRRGRACRLGREQMFPPEKE